MAEPATKLPETREVKERHPIAVASHPTGGLIPQSFEQLWRLSVVMAQSGMMPKGMEKPEAVFVAVQMGLEVGLSPMQAVQNIAVINGRPTIWGDSALGLVRASGELEEFKEWITGTPMENDWTAHCHVKRDGYEPRENSFSLAEARAAGLYPPPDKFSPWGKYPRRMLQMRARSWALRDEFTDVLKGLQIREEQADIKLVEVEPGKFGMEEVAPAALESRLVAFDGMVEAVEDNERIGEYVDFLAKHFNTTAESIKGEAAESEKSWQDFINTYHAWCEKHPAKDAKKLPCPWPKCDFEGVSERGLKKHITQQHEGKEPPESPPEPSAPTTIQEEKTTATEPESKPEVENKEKSNPQMVACYRCGKKLPQDDMLDYEKNGETMFWCGCKLEERD